MPMQLRHIELYDLLALLGLPDVWEDRDCFVNVFTTRRALRTILAKGVSSDPTTEIETQQTLDGKYQAGLDSTLSESERVYLQLSGELRLEDEASARQRLLTACRLMRSDRDTYDEFSAHSATQPAMTHHTTRSPTRITDTHSAPRPYSTRCIPTNTISEYSDLNE